MLIDIVRKDIETFLQEENLELFFNERDFQLHLATYLRESGHYDDVDIEYYVPYAELSNYIWKNELYLDIVVKKEGEFIPIELKYPTARVAKKITRFDENLHEDVVIVKHQGAQDLVAYAFWKDVRRIELVKKRFRAVTAGLAVILTNDDSYLRPRRKDSNCVQMDVVAGTHAKTRHWIHATSITQDRPNFDLDNKYDVAWQSCKLEDQVFHYCIIEIK